MAEIVGEIVYRVSLETGTALRQARDIERQNKRTADSFSPITFALSQITRAIGAYAAALLLISQSDAYTKLNAQLKLATDGSRELAIAQDQVRRIAKEAQTDISGVAVLYARITNATKELGTSQNAVAAITRTVALALKVSGAGAQESASATLQLSQAFASGVLRGEEFNAVSEAAPRLMKALADGIGVPIGQLRSMAEQGKLTSEVLATALPKALRELEQEAKQVQTISGAFQELRNELLLFIGEQTTASGAARATADIISTLAANIDTLAAAAYGFLAAKLARVLLDVGISAANSARGVLQGVEAAVAARAAAIAGAQAEVAKQQATLVSLAATKQAILAAREQTVAELQLMNAFRARGLAMTQIGAATTSLAVLGQQQARVTAQQAAATAALTAAQTALTGATAAAGAAGSLAARALGFLGGPIGAITTLLGLGAAAWSLWGSSADEGERKAVEITERSTDEIVAGLDKQISRLKERNALASAGLPGIAKQETDAAQKLATLQGQINDLMAGRGINGGAPLAEEARVGLLQTLLRQYAELASKVRDVSTEQEKLENFGNSKKLSDWMMRYATDAELAAKEVKKARDELGSAFTPELEKRIRDRFIKKGPKVDDGYLEALQAEARIQEEQDEAVRRFYEEQQRREERAANDRARGVTVAQDTIVAGDEVARLQLELERKSELLTQYAALDQENLQLYADAKVALERDTQAKIAEAVRKGATDQMAAQSQMLVAYGNIFGSLAEMTKAFGGEQSGAYKAMFAVSKAFAIADSIIKIQQGIAGAMSLPFPANIAAAASTAAAASGLISTITGTNFAGGRRYGGLAEAGNLYGINESGAPEMFMGRNGSQYMLPTQSGRVVPADQVGGGVTLQVQVINSHPTAQVSTSMGADGRTVQIAVGEVARQISENSGPVWSAMRGSTNVRSAL